MAKTWKLVEPTWSTDSPAKTLGAIKQSMVTNWTKKQVQSNKVEYTYKASTADLLGRVSYIASRVPKVTSGLETCYNNESISKKYGATLFTSRYDTNVRETSSDNDEYVVDLPVFCSIQFGMSKAPGVTNAMMEKLLLDAISSLYDDSGAFIGMDLLQEHIDRTND